MSTEIVRKCKRCKIDKPHDDFNKTHVNSEGVLYRRFVCKSCMKKQRDSRKEERKLYDEEYRKNNKKKIKLDRIKAKYGLSSNDFETMLFNQDNKCLGCGDILTKPCVDHCHKTGKIRGILCTHCNRALGAVKDSISTLEALIKYCKEHC